MDSRSLELFATVAQRGSFAAVAKERNVDPSSISRTIAELEAELGLRLFQRTTRSMTLTEAGEIYLARIEPLIEELVRAREAAAQVTGTPRGVLRLTASVTFGQTRIVPMLPEFRRRYPELGVECIFTDANMDLVADRIDLAVRLAPAVEGEVIATKLMDTQYRVVASAAYLAAHPPLRAPSDLSARRVLLFNLRAYRTRWLFRDRAGHEESVPIAGDVTISPAGSLLTAAAVGLGPALLPDWLVDDAIRDGVVADVFPDHRVTATTFETAAWLVYPSRNYLPGKVRAMVDYLKEQLAARQSR